jgi:hypothetical protein
VEKARITPRGAVVYCMTTGVRPYGRPFIAVVTAAFLKLSVHTFVLIKMSLEGILQGLIGHVFGRTFDFKFPRECHYWDRAT